MFSSLRGTRVVWQRPLKQWLLESQFFFCRGRTGLSFWRGGTRSPSFSSTVKSRVLYCCMLEFRSKLCTKVGQQGVELLRGSCFLACCQTQACLAELRPAQHHVSQLHLGSSGGPATGNEVSEAVPLGGEVAWPSSGRRPTGGRSMRFPDAPCTCPGWSWL